MNTRPSVGLAQCLGVPLVCPTTVLKPQIEHNIQYTCFVGSPGVDLGWVWLRCFNPPSWASHFPHFPGVPRIPQQSGHPPPRLQKPKPRSAPVTCKQSAESLSRGGSGGVVGVAPSWGLPNLILTCAYFFFKLKNSLGRHPQTPPPATPPFGENPDPPLRRVSFIHMICWHAIVRVLFRKDMPVDLYYYGNW